MSSNAPIGFLDSGIGGVTVLTEALKLLPNEDYVFFSDSKNNPYGDKENEQIISRCEEIVDMLISKHSCKAIVIACNTASARAAESLRQKYSLPIIAIEPAYKMVHDLNPEGFTLVMATKGTLESEKFHHLYYKYYNQKSALIPCVGLADVIEQNDEQGIDSLLSELLKDYVGIAENVVLGCTHYPLAKANIQKQLGDVRFFDGAPGTSRQLKRRLEENHLLSTSTQKGKITFIDTSAQPDEKEKRFFAIINSSEEQI